MSKIIEDAQSALSKLEKIQNTFEEENKVLKALLDKNKNISKEIQQNHEDIMCKISECINKFEKSITSFRELNIKQDEIIDNVMLSLETKTRNNLKIAQENLNQLNLEISNYINDFKKVITGEFSQLLANNFNDLEKLLELKKKEIIDLNCSIEEKLNTILALKEQKINDLVKKQNNQLKKYFYIIIGMGVVIGIILILFMFK